MLISEVFGRAIDDLSSDATDIRARRHCPFRDTKCTKASKSDPLGVCSLSDGKYAAAICPVRFLEGDRIFKDAAAIAFGKGADIAVFPEVRILRIESTGGKSKKIGKVDFVLGRIADGKITDFAAMEVQAVYFSGESIRPSMRHFLTAGSIDPTISDRRPDFRSSAQKRLAPQLMLKVPVFRRWAKKFFVVVDSQFFSRLPVFKQIALPNSELTWLSYPISKIGAGYEMGSPVVAGSIWDDIAASLREGTAPDPAEITAELQLKLDGPKKSRPRLLSI